MTFIYKIEKEKRIKVSPFVVLYNYIGNQFRAAVASKKVILNFEF